MATATYQRVGDNEVNAKICNYLTNTTKMFALVPNVLAPDTQEHLATQVHLPCFSLLF